MIAATSSLSTEHWTGGTWFLHAPHSKMTRKEHSVPERTCSISPHSNGTLAHTYPEILRFLRSRLPDKVVVKILLDDEARGHGGTMPDNFLGTLEPPVSRVRIQGTCTADLQAADQFPNQEFKGSARKKLETRRQCLGHSGGDHTKLNCGKFNPQFLLPQ